MTFVRHIDHTPGIFGDKSRAGRYLNGNDVLLAIRDVREAAKNKVVTADQILEILHDGLAECLTHDARG